MDNQDEDNEVPESNVINFARAVKERTGVVLNEELIASAQKQQKERTAVDPEQDVVAKMALAVLRATEDYADERPIAVLAALQLAGSVIGRQLVEHYGKDETMRMSLTALNISRQYQEERKTNA